jgi:hypothetical protein
VGDLAHRSEGQLVAHRGDGVEVGDEVDELTHDGSRFGGVVGATDPDGHT